MSTEDARDDASAETGAPTGGNWLLRRMPEEDMAFLRPGLEPVTLENGRLIEAPDEPIPHVYFPQSGICSTVAHGASGRKMEVALFGREGMSGMAILLHGNQSPTETVVQVAGFGHRIESGLFRQALERSPALHRMLLRYVQAAQTQSSQTAVSNGYGKLDERLSRWLLMCHDRVEGDGLPLSHQFLSIMLGVRRAGVTVGLHELEGKGLIRAERMMITVLDRAGLLAHANGSYGVPEREYARLMA